VASGVLLVGAAAALALLAFAIWRFDASLARRPVAWYAALLGASGVLVWCATRLRPATRIAAAVLGVSTVLAFYGADAELVLAARAREIRVQERLAERNGMPPDARTVPEVVRDYRASGVPAVPSVVPAVLLGHFGPGGRSATAWPHSFLPLAGISGRPTVPLCKDDGQFRLFPADEHGFGNPLPSWSGTAHGVVLVGDSFTYGYCVDPEENLASHLRHRWPSTLSLGTGGSGPLVELATLSEYAAPLRPRVVVWEFFFNDMADLAIERRHPLLLRYLDASFTQGLLGRQAEIDSAIESWIETMYTALRGMDTSWGISWYQLLTLFHVRGLLTNVVFGPPESRDPGSELGLFRVILQTARDRVQAWGGRLYFVYVPEWERYYQPAALAKYDLRDSVLRIARGLGVPVVDFVEVVRDHPRRLELFARRDLARGHFTGMGYELMADQVAKVIEQDARFPILR
jgi:hypothetical protein